MKCFTMFGRYFRELRKEKTGLTLRQFCREHELDAGNLSKLERGRFGPPSSREKLEEYAGYLQIEEGSNEWYTFFDLAAACSGKIPDDVLSDEELVMKLPLVFRSLRGQQPTSEELDKIIDIVRRS